MSLYRETRGTSARRAGVAVVASAILVVAGFGLGRATAPDTTLEDNVASVRDQASEITDALELVPLHYESTNATTRQGALDQLARARATFAGLEPQLALLDREGAAEASKALTELERLAQADAAPADVDAAATEARRAVRAAAGIQ